MLICYAVWLAHKASDVWSEVDMLAVRADELAQLVGQIQVPDRAVQPEWSRDRTISAPIDQASAT
jgi:hypothetical protein